MKNKSKILLYAIIAILIILTDRFTKSWALTLLNERIITPFLSFGLAFNRGLSWGMLNSDNTYLFLILNMIIAVVIVAMIGYTIYCWRHQQPIIGPVLILAGALSNYFDRIYYGAVIDFIVVSFGSWSWPAFNIADAAIVCGVGLILLTHYKNS